MTRVTISAFRIVLNTARSLLHGNALGAIALSAAICALLTAGCTQPETGMMAQFPSPMEEGVRMHERVSDVPPQGDTLSLDGILPSRVLVLVPQTPSGEGLLIHFHGGARVPFSVPGYVVASVNLGSGSSAYERPFSESGVFPSLLAALERTTDEEFESITLSGWSAGYGSIRAILRTHADRIDHVVLLDGLHTDYVPDRLTLFAGGQLNTEKLEPFLAFGRLALNGPQSLTMTHSEVFPGTYASTMETASFLAEALGLRRRAVLEWGPVGMQLISRADSGNVSILGYAGNTAPDHVDHLHALPALLSR